MNYFVDKCSNGDIKLAGSGYSSMGRVSICVNGVWGSVCSNSFDAADASVVCAHLGFSRYGQYAISCYVA